MSDHPANIGILERRKRFILGLCLLATSIVLLFITQQQQLSLWWRLVLFFPLWISMLGFMQARAKT